MEFEKMYIINVNTVALVPEYDGYGHLCTRVIEGPYSFVIKASPLQIMKESLNHYGHNLEGATMATKRALGPVDMAPVKVSSSLGLYWFPSESPLNNRCIWFSLKHIIRPVKLTRTRTNVILKYGHIITIDSNVTRFKNKIHNARDLESILAERTDEKAYYITQTGVSFVKEPEHLSYHIIQTSQKMIIKRIPPSSNQKDESSN